MAASAGFASSVPPPSARNCVWTQSGKVGGAGKGYVLEGKIYVAIVRA